MHASVGRSTPKHGQPERPGEVSIDTGALGCLTNLRFRDGPVRRFRSSLLRTKLLKGKPHLHGPDHDKEAPDDHSNDVASCSRNREQDDGEGYRNSPQDELEALPIHPNPSRKLARYQALPVATTYMD